MNPLMITAAIVGAETMREHTPYIPYTPEEIAQEAKRCADEGAVMVHVHGRLEDGTPTQSKAVFEEILHKIRERSDVLVQFSTGGAVGMDVEERIEALDLLPDMATLTTGSINFGDEIFANDWPTIQTIAQRLKTYAIRPEIEVFDSAMVDTALRLVKSGLIAAPLHFDFVLGMAGGMGASTRHLDFLLQSIPDDSTWCVAGLGRHQLVLAQESMQRGGHVRVGLEDNIYLSKGVLAQGSFELVRHVARDAAALGRPLATIEEAKRILRLQ